MYEHLFHCSVAQQHRQDRIVEITKVVAAGSSKASSSNYGPTCTKILLCSRLTSATLVPQMQNEIQFDPRINTTLELFQHLSTTIIILYLQETRINNYN